ncbi:hypothetical protein ACFOGJ_25975 [Marinibaculum pumilum]|uniref:Uncharacterized protein n=1 Tax=Marinibaculum pumilum TaxID=1766165 RepID=A0ABV7L7X5_9PROT
MIVASQLAAPGGWFNLSLGRQRIALVAGRTHPLARRRRLRLRELAD